MSVLEDSESSVLLATAVVPIPSPGPVSVPEEPHSQSGVRVSPPKSNQCAVTRRKADEVLGQQK